MTNYIERRAMTHEQVWIIRDLHSKGTLNIAEKAREYETSPKTIRRRFVETTSYPIFETQRDARIRDQFQTRYCVDTADLESMGLC